MAHFSIPTPLQVVPAYPEVNFSELLDQEVSRDRCPSFDCTSDSANLSL